MPVNIAAVTGNLTRDAEMRMTQGGIAALNFTVAVNNRRKGQNGQWFDDPMFLACAMFGDRAQKIAQYLRKGVKVAVTGRLNESKWERNGERRSRIELIVNEIDIMQRLGGQPNQMQPQMQPQPQMQAPQPQDRWAEAQEDIPF